MVKKQTFVVLLALLSTVGSVFGLGLGDIAVKSNLNDPLDAEIKLIQLQGLSAGEILPTLASNDDFRRAGVERSFFLANIQFLVKENDTGDLVVTLTTRQAVREPFLNFLVEVNWPGGRLLKEYTILLDPPVFDTGLAVDALVVEPSSIRQPTALVTTTIIDQEPTEQTTVVSKPVTPRSDVLADGQYRVKRNDTLWEIALKVPGGSSYSPQQVMLAIQDVNPNAFLRNNINRLKAGSVLTLPTEAQIAARSLDEAISEVQAQNSGAAPKLRNQSNTSSEVQLSASESTSSAMPTGGETQNPDGYLELTADSESNTASAAGDVSATVDALQNQLTAAEELNDQYAAERDALETRVRELQEQIAIMERMVEIENNDLAEVQQALAANQDASDAMPITELPDVVAPAADATTAMSDDTMVTDVSPAVVTPEVTQPEPAVVVQTPAPAPVAAKPQSFMDKVFGYVDVFSAWVMASVTNMAIAGAAVVLLILLPLYIRSKRSSGDQTLDEINESSGSGLNDHFEEEIEDDLLAEAENDYEEEFSEEPEALDAVVEAEMYMAYQKYDQAEEKLKEAFSEHPDRADIGLKLLEVYAETGDVNAFGDLESRLSLDTEQQILASELREKLPVGASHQTSELDADLMAGDLNLDLDADSDLGDDLDLNFTDNDEDLSAISEELTTLSSDDEFDFSLDLDSEEPILTSVNEELLGSDDEDESTDLDFSLDLDDLEDKPVAAADDLDFSLDELEDELSGEDEAPSLDLDADSEQSGNAEVLDFTLNLDEEDDLEVLSSQSDTAATLQDLDAELDLLDLEMDEPKSESEVKSIDLDDELESKAEEIDLDEVDLELDEEASDAVTLNLDDLDDLDVNESTEADDAIDIDLDSTDDDFLDIDLSEDLDSIESKDDPLQALADSLESDADLDEDEFDFLSGSDEASTKLDLARAYIEMDDREGAKDILEEVLVEGNEEQKAQAETLISKL